jgi:hypothetical protein
MVDVGGCVGEEVGIGNSDWNLVGIDWAKRIGDSGGKNAGEGLKLVGNRA